LKKVAAYCRVSTDKADQMNSFESQQRFFRAYIQRQEDWELYEVYADEGITGTSTKKRKQFNRMMADAHMGRFQLIVTKEVSRFSRNILDTIACTRELKALGIGVIFMGDGFSTLEPDSELRLSIMGSIAQEESRKTSARVKWGQARQMERGVVFGRSLLGYEVENGALIMEPKGAQVVRRIFHQYAIEKKGTGIIARQLQMDGIQTRNGNLKWHSSHIIKILKNEKYVGDLVQRKSYTPDYLTHAKKTNHGEEELIILRKHHEPIISRELWELTQSELEKRSRQRRGEGCSTKYGFSGRIRCGECGGIFISRQRKDGQGRVVRRWRCSNAGMDGCTVGRQLRDDRAKDLVKQTLSALRLNTDMVLEQTILLALEAIRADNRGLGDNPARLREKLDQEERKRAYALDLFLSGTLSQEELQSVRHHYDTSVALLRQRLQSAEEGGHQTYCDTSMLRAELNKKLEELLAGETESESMYAALVECITVYKDHRLMLKLKDLPQTFCFDG